MQLFYAPDITPPEYTLSEEESKHCIRVLRLAEGSRLHITDGRGTLYECEITTADLRKCRVRVVAAEHEYGKMPYRLIMAVAPTKNIDRFEWFLEKATEVGISGIIPLETARSERRTLKPERAEKVIAAAMKQSLKCFCPHLHPMTTFAELLAMPFDGRKFIAHCDASGERHFLGDMLHAGEDAMVLIGPEGDFSGEEIAAALAHGFEPVTLGHQRLRTETAAVVATVIAATINN